MQLSGLRTPFKAAPRRWGYSPKQPAGNACLDGCPTQVGIFLKFPNMQAVFPRLPHAGGDIPLIRFLKWTCKTAAPRRWGYSDASRFNGCQRLGCPTQVGIFRLGVVTDPSLSWLPHAGGDIPHWTFGTNNASLAAPRRWGYSFLLLILSP